MLRFFRQIRKTLMEHLPAGQAGNKVRTYLLYAVGEIFLVMLGILLALQVSNWNEESRLKVQEADVIESLRLETLSNKDIISLCISEMAESLTTLDTLKQYLGPEYAGLEKKRLNYLIGFSGSTDRCQIETDILDELRSSGNLKLIRNQDLRVAISKWSTAYVEVKKEEEEWEAYFNDHYLGYMNKWISWDDVDLIFSDEQDIYTFYASNFEYDPNKVLQEFEYSNHLNNLHWRMRRVQNRLKATKSQTSVVDSLIIRELNQ